MSGNAIPLEETLNPYSPNYMVFDDELPAISGGLRAAPATATAWRW